MTTTPQRYYALAAPCLACDEHCTEECQCRCHAAVSEHDARNRHQGDMTTRRKPTPTHDPEACRIRARIADDVLSSVCPICEGVAPIPVSELLAVLARMVRTHTGLTSDDKRHDTEALNARIAARALLARFTGEEEE